MTERNRTPGRTGSRQSGVARVPVLVVSLVLISTLSLVALDRLFLPERFAISEVIVAGDAPNVDPAAVLQTVRRLGPRSWFSVDLDEVEDAVLSVPWVYRASVRRRWPGKLVVTVAQAEPFARWNDGWVNASGEPLRLPADFAGSDLPRLSGPADRAASVVAQYRELAVLFDADDPATPRSLSMNARGAWRLGLVERGAGRLIHITIGRERMAERVSRLAAALRAGLGGRLADISAFDLRYPNGFAVTFADGAQDGVAKSRSPQSGGDTG